MTRVGLLPSPLPVIRLLVSLGLLVLLARWLDVGQLAERLGNMQAHWVALALLLSVVQVAASTWRWCFTARRLGIELPFFVALREYYLAMFLNQVIPGGVVGDVSRAWRHARALPPETSSGPAVRAVILERASGQIAMAIVATLSVMLLPFDETAVWVWTAIAASAVTVGSWFWVRGHTPNPSSVLGRFLHDARLALFTRQAFPAQCASSIVVVTTYLMTYVIAARAIGIATPTSVLLPLVAPVLLTMLVPVTIAGWGVRESAAAVLWGVVGLTAVDGVAISVAYGLLVLLSTIPGGVVLGVSVMGRGQ